MDKTTLPCDRYGKCVSPVYDYDGVQSQHVAGCSHGVGQCNSSVHFKYTQCSTGGGW